MGKGRFCRAGAKASILMVCWSADICGKRRKKRKINSTLLQSVSYFPTTERVEDAKIPTKEN